MTERLHTMSFVKILRDLKSRSCFTEVTSCTGFLLEHFLEKLIWYFRTPAAHTIDVVPGLLNINSGAAMDDADQAFSKKVGSINIASCVVNSMLLVFCVPGPS